MLTAMGDVMRQAYEKGWITTRDGNISLCRRNSKTLYITPSGWRKTIIHPEHIIKVQMTLLAVPYQKALPHLVSLICTLDYKGTISQHVQLCTCTYQYYSGYVRRLGFTRVGSRVSGSQ